MARRYPAEVARARPAGPSRPGLELVPDLAFALVFGTASRGEDPAAGARGGRSGRGGATPIGADEPEGAAPRRRAL